MKVAACVVGGTALALAYVVLEDIVLSHTAFADPRKYAHANDWFGLDFLLDIPIGVMIFAPLFAAALLKRDRLPGMSAGILLAGSLYVLFIVSYVPADRSLGGNVPPGLVLAWGGLSVLCAWLGHRLWRRARR